MKQVSIIILNFNGLELLKNNLPILVNCLKPNISLEIIIVDNNSSDSSVKFIKEDFPQIRVLELKENHSFGEALNLAAKEAKNDLLLFLNNDVEVSADFIKPLIEHFKDNRVFGVTPKVLRPTQGMINESVITGAFKGGVISAEFSISQTRKIPDYAFETFSVCGAAMMIDKKKFTEIGGFDKMLRPFYYEETDLSYRALKHGWKIFYEPASVVYHQHNQSIGKYLKKSTALWSYRKNQYLTVWKNITDPWLMARHIIEMVIPKLLTPNLIEWKALFSALIQIPEIITRRKEQKRHCVLSDKEIFRLASDQINKIRGR
ncbi:hypothetical protein A2276_08255 [candidate division WOR-1 bacterium RIFOXYA12_FULL_43_27]|uniref:Glycosyltransferase 2-like domain-containing protein n=1 Tax=candidate division WOR-1 bacterium RIFOXYC2_FULL_46_14 TaxID=1802587 RepID=A0A1F4U636_UNCSA|nr:MAG: hypothetical protein A2276_08255 [candidate division WOR-1 bacterium RIFOXYA12_FULL_43_27]OGC20587.1 MAG: hypothetical protein A2292_06080 [candidate division WOR-1 bacterium RIFOXYB2_FULL_46_45]OGC31676.1 MAG: hypothetical protein A2232_05370 [candidate division WOR-1 bacterium RIFOXYA2_FULL_46_56]OGC40428.1 MAG: hypothetical protein A2438_04110 [candidate division WOR-1 bacterium RIFOXYC2_FULL_46_14]